MDATLDEDFVNFEAFSQTCASTALTSGADEEIRLLDNEASQRERRVQGEKLNGTEEGRRLSDASRTEMKPPSQRAEGGGEPTGLPSEYHLFTTFSYNSSSKKLTMIPVRYKIKEERRKVLKISVNKLKKIDDPESWLCRSVLINNTMKKLQKETRDEKISKQMGVLTQTKTLGGKGEEFGCELSNNNNDSSQNDKNARNNKGGEGDAECFYGRGLGGEGFYKVGSGKSEEFLFQVEKGMGGEGRSGGKGSGEGEEEKLSISGGVSLNEDFVEKIPSIKRCASRKKSVDEDGTADEILNLGDSELVLSCENKSGELEDVDECDVHDVLSQLYMPPTPRMLTSIDSDTDEDELNVVDIDSSYIESMKGECEKLPGEGFLEGGLSGGKREREGEGEGEEGGLGKRRKVEDVFSCFSVCEESYESFLCGNRNGESDRTSEGSREGGKGAGAGAGAGAEEELIELEDEEDIKRRLSQSLSSHYHRKPDKTCESFFEDNCDNQYSCGHTVTMFSDMQSVTFHNLIASLET